MIHTWGDDFRALIAERLYNEAWKLYSLKLWDLYYNDRAGYEKIQQRAKTKWTMVL
jgi:hypothetical protein